MKQAERKPMNEIPFERRVSVPKDVLINVLGGLAEGAPLRRREGEGRVPEVGSMSKLVTN